MVLVHALVFVILRLLSPLADAANFEVLNRCSYTVWAASSPGGGGLRLDTGQSWKLYVPDGTAGARVWGRTNCNFDENGRGSCASGDCDGVLQCNSNGSAPNTLARYALSQSSNSSDFIDISLEEGFNIPMDFSPTSGSCLRGIRCAGNSILDQCPDQLRAPGGCQNPCGVYKTDEYCCTGGGSCGPTDLSRFFKERCPDAYSYPKDGQTSNFTCPQGTDYRVTFCP